MSALIIMPCLNCWDYTELAVADALGQTVEPTGSELVDWREAARKQPLPPGAIIETNSIFLAGLVRQAGGIYGVFSEDEVRSARAGLQSGIERTTEGDDLLAAATEAATPATP